MTTPGKPLLTAAAVGGIIGYAILVIAAPLLVLYCIAKITGVL